MKKYKLTLLFVGFTFTESVYGVVLPPTFSPASAQTATPTGVIATSPTAGATVYYTTNGVNPTTNDPFVSNGGVIEIPRTLTLKAMAFSGGSASTVTTANYKVVGQIAAGSLQGIALKSSGYPSSWGFSHKGSLGDLNNFQTPQPTPSRMKLTASDMFSYGRDTAAGYWHSAVVDSYGRVVCYGDNSSGQLGDGTTTTPADFYPRFTWTNYQQELQGMIQVAAAHTYTSALSSSGFVYTWGGNLTGRLGRIDSGGFYNYAGAVQRATSPFPALSGIAQISAGQSQRPS